MNVLMISKDPSLFDASGKAASDTRERHGLYARRLRERAGASSTLRVIGYAPRSANRAMEALPDGLTLYPTASVHRATLLADVMRCLPGVLDGWRPDLVTTQTPWEEGVLGLALARGLDAAFLPQLHFDLFADTWRREHWLNGWRRAVACRVLRAAGTARVVSGPLARQVVARLGLATERVHTVPVGVNFSPAPWGDKERLGLAGHPVVLFVGRFYAPKNLTLWLEVAAAVHARMPQARFVMAGDGPLMGPVREAIARLSLDSVVTLLGNVPHAELPAVYAAADVFMLTSHYEGYGRVVAEAFLAGVPVVSTRCAGPEDLVQEGSSGYLVALGDREGLVEGVVDLLGDSRRARAMGEVGRAHVRQHLAAPVLIERLVDAWMAAAGQGASAP